MVFVQTGKQVDAVRQVFPEQKDPNRVATRMMQRPEIRDHIREIYRQISEERNRAAAIAARSTLLTLEVADERLMEILEQPRKTLGQMLTKDTKQLFMKGAVQITNEEGRSEGYALTDDVQVLMDGAAPVEDSDLLKAIDLTYKRKGGIIKAEKEEAPGPVTVMLYKPKWFGQPRPQPPMLEGI